MISTAFSGVSSPVEPLEQHADLLLDERRERVAVAQRVVDREAERLVVAAGAEADDRLDDLDVVGVVAGARRAEHADLGQPVEHVGRQLVALEHLAARRARAVGLLEHLADQPQRHEPLLLQALDRADPVDELRRVVRHVAARPHRLRQQPLAQVVLDRARRDAGLRRRARSSSGPAWRSCDRSRLAQRADLVGRQPGLGQHRVGVGAARRTGRAGRVRGRARQPHRRAEQPLRSRSSTTMSPARASASSRSSTGSTQQSCSSLNACHSSRVRAANSCSTSRCVSDPTGSNWRSARSARPTPWHHACQNFGSSAPSVTQPSAQRYGR